MRVKSSHVAWYVLCWASSCPVSKNLVYLAWCCREGNSRVHLFCKSEAWRLTWEARTRISTWSTCQATWGKGKLQDIDVTMRAKLSMYGPTCTAANLQMWRMYVTRIATSECFMIDIPHCVKLAGNISRCLWGSNRPSRGCAGNVRLNIRRPPLSSDGETGFVTLRPLSLHHSWGVFRCLVELDIAIASWTFNRWDAYFSRPLIIACACWMFLVFRL